MGEHLDPSTGSGHRLPRLTSAYFGFAQ